MGFALLNQPDPNTSTGGPVGEWIERAIPAGSGRYYAILHSAPELQQRQNLIVTLISIFSKLGFENRELEVAKHKLDWWRNDLAQEQSQHPVTAALQPSTEIREMLTSLLNAYGSLIENGSPSTTDENHRFHIETGAAACELLTDSSHEVVHQVGTTLSKIRCYRYLRIHVDKGLLCFPLQQLDDAGVSPANLVAGTTDQAALSFVHNLQDTLIKQVPIDLASMTKLIEATPTAKRAELKSLFIYLRLQEKLLNAIGDTALDEVTRLTPLRNYWYAFQGARKFDRTAVRSQSD